MPPLFEGAITHYCTNDIERRFWRAISMSVFKEVKDKGISFVSNDDPALSFTRLSVRLRYHLSGNEFTDCEIACAIVQEIVYELVQLGTLLLGSLDAKMVIDPATWESVWVFYGRVASA